MFWDYCRRENRHETNEFEPGDTVLFASYRDSLYIDTIFVVGEWRAWPEHQDQIPNWPDLDDVALRMHFQARAHRDEHGEVHRAIKGRSVRSYRGRSHDEDDSIFSWAPYLPVSQTRSAIAGRPFCLDPNDASAGTHLAALFCSSGSFLSGCKGSFPILTIATSHVRELHEALRSDARQQGYLIGTGFEFENSESTDS